MPIIGKPLWIDVTQIEVYEGGFAQGLKCTKVEIPEHISNLEDAKRLSENINMWYLVFIINDCVEKKLIDEDVAIKRAALNYGCKYSDIRKYKEFKKPVENVEDIIKEMNSTYKRISYQYSKK